MSVLLNGRLLADDTPPLLLNRGFRYGDGCFETLLVHNGSCPLLALHQQRLHKSLKVLGLSWPDGLEIEKLVAQLCSGQQGWQRLRIWIWRAGEGLYTPQGAEAEVAAAVQASQAPQLHIHRSVALSEHTRLAHCRWSFVKSTSALTYVQAGLEKQEKGVDELLLLNGKGELAEASSANLFIKKRNRWFTPALSTGCVAGVMRAHLMQQLLQKGEPVYEVHALPEELGRVDKVVCTNVSGLYPLSQYEDTAYQTDIAELVELLPRSYQDSL